MSKESVTRLSSMAEVSWLQLEGPDRTVGLPPADRPLLQGLMDFVAQLDVLIVSYGCPRVTAEVMDRGPRLRMIGDTHGDRRGERVDLLEAEARGIQVVDTTNASSDPVAEWALALMIVGLRNAGSLFRRLIAGEVLWPDHEAFRADPGYLHGELAGKLVGLIALGHIGRRLVSLLRPFGVRVLAHDPGAPPALADLLDLDLVPLDAVVSEPDVVVCTVPLTEPTRGLLGKRELDLLRPGAVFVNVSRGAVVDTAALIERLARGDIVACLDVVEPEPIPAGSPLRHMGNVFLSPHIAGVTAEAEPRFFDRMVDEVARVLAGHEARYPLVLREGPIAPESR
jgi:phosphoglycerate dehydrogenase-like enzyme